MDLAEAVAAPLLSKATSLAQADDISAKVFLSNTEQYGLDRLELEDFQLRAAQRRFEKLRPQVAALRDQAERVGVTKIDALEDLVPLLFNHAVYKSYPVSVLENRRFDLLTKWLQRATAIDLSNVDVTGCDGIDEWMDRLEAQTPAQIYHTSGTSGKLSFFVRTGLERDLWNTAYIKNFEGFGDEPGNKFGGADGIRLPVIYPSMRHGRYMAQRLIRFLETSVAPTPEECYTLNNGTLSADIIALSGRVRIAQAKGMVSEMKLRDSERAALKRYIEDTARRPQEVAAFFDTMLTELRGKRVFLFSQTSYLVQAAQAGFARGISGVFSANSCVHCGGGGKGVVLPANWAETTREFTGVRKLSQGFGMTELTGSSNLCPHGHYHLQQFIIPFLLTPDGQTPLPRQGRQTGRLAALDLAAQHLWGGVVTGDMVRIDWDEPCACGRKGPYIHADINRYDESVTGDDKISCAATIDNTDAALQALLN